MTDIRKKVDMYVTLKTKQSLLQEDISAMEADILKHGEELLADTKYKSVRIIGESNSRAVSVTNAETLKVTYPSLLKDIFGKVYADCVKEEITYTVNAHGKRILISLLTGAYNAGESLERLVDNVSVDKKTNKILSKKLKGINFDTDKRTLMNVCGMGEETASDYAYMAMEAVAWQNINNLMKINDVEDSPIPAGNNNLSVLKEKTVRSAAVDQTVKVSIIDIDV
ncbi:MAG: hypothetical protein FWE74_07555 [Oscillospiraceae bacterium]|nr:hypothetical protein [Oscillospiraceae bacterium]